MAFRTLASAWHLANASFRRLRPQAAWAVRNLAAGGDSLREQLAAAGAVPALLAALAHRSPATVEQARVPFFTSTLTNVRAVLPNALIAVALRAAIGLMLLTFCTAGGGDTRLYSMPIASSTICFSMSIKLSMQAARALGSFCTSDVDPLNLPAFEHRRRERSAAWRPAPASRATAFGRPSSTPALCRPSLAC